MKHTFVLLFVLLSFTSFSQNHFVGIKGAVALTNVTELAIENKSIVGPSYGLTYEYFITPKISLGVELLYNSKGFRNEIIESTPSGEPIRSVSIDNVYQFLSVPVKLGYVLNEKRNLFVKLGVAPAVLLSSETKVSGTNVQPYNASHNWGQVKSFNYFSIAELGINLKTFDSSSIYTTVGGYYGLGSVFNTPIQLPIDANHYGFEASVGYRMSI